MNIYVLIDTWWNVNSTITILTLAENRFNRYMVECEFLWSCRHNQRIPGFNRYMVECEYLFADVDKSINLSFNRYMVECEYP